MKQDTINQLITGILTSPLLYIPHYHYRYVDELLGEIFPADNEMNSVLGLSSEAILEFDVSRGIIDFQTKRERKLDCWSKLEILLGDLINRPSDFVEERILLIKNLNADILDHRIQSLLQTFATLYESGNVYNPLFTIILVSPLPISEFPSTLIDITTVIDIKAPTNNEIEEIVENLQVSTRQTKESKALKGELCRTLQGLQLFEIRQILRSALIKTNNVITESTNEYALQEKKRIVRKSGIVEVVDSDISFKDIGGLSTLRRDLEDKAKIYRHLNLATSNRSQIPLPKGVLIIGMPGCGKSMIAKAIAREFGVSLLRLDISRLMGQYVGQSEENLRRALVTAEAAHPCVLWIDEIEKAFHGANSSGNENDTLVMRMMGYFLTWMQERKSAVYIVATANDVLRPEFMRKGRFDEVYFVDFPNAEERKRIFEKKIEKYNNTPTTPSIFDFSQIIENGKQKGRNALDEIVEATKAKASNRGWNGYKEESDKGFTGAEIESVVNAVVEMKFREYVDNYEKEKSKGDKWAEASCTKITLNDFLSIIETMKKGALCNQSFDDERLGQVSPVEGIRKMQLIYHFKPAS